MPKSLSTGVVGILLASWVFLIPTHFFVTCCRDQASVQGLQNNYLVPTLYASELVGLLLIVVLFPITIKQVKQNWHDWNTKQRWIAGSLLLIVAVLIIFSLTTTFPLISIINWGKLLLLGWLGIGLTALLKQSERTAYLRWILIGLFASIWFQVGLGWYQYASQSHLVGYQLLGEPLYTSLPSLSSVTSPSGQEVRLAYGTTAHPNVLANITVLYTILLWLIAPLCQFAAQEKRINKLTRFALIATTALAGSAILITHSVSAMLLAVCGGVMIRLRQRQSLSSLFSSGRKRILAFVILGASLMFVIPGLIGLLTNQFPGNYSLQRRAWLQRVAIEITSSQPLTGVGLAQFTPQVAQFAQTPDQWRFLQPVHNTGWLWLAETGLLGLLLLIGSILLTSAALQIGFITSLALLLIPFSVDHFFFSLPEGRAVLLLTVVLITLNISKRQKA